VHYRMSHSSSYDSCFVFGRSSVEISAQRPAIPTEVIRGFPRPLQANVGIVFKIR
jgi:hypothetical protein